MATSVGAELISASAPRFTTPPAHCPVEHEALTMRTSYLCLTLLAIGIGLTGATSTWNEATSQVPQTPAASQLRPAPTFARISDQRSRSIALFEEARTGNLDIGAILDHVVTDSKVTWSWSPGPGRTPAPGTNAQFGELLRGWAEAGAQCPTR